MPSLFDPLQLGEVALKNRIVMAPLTRARSGEERTPGPLVAQYYAQRASAGLIIGEATSVTPMGVGYAGTPGLWSEAQVAGWKLTTEAVHRAGGLIFAQLWHVGRISDPGFLDGQSPVSASAIAAKGNVSLLQPKRPYPVPRALALAEIAGVVEAYRRAAENAERAGFDGVELHGANGYLLDQFLQDGSNKRDDAYGGPIEHRARLMLEAVDAAISVFGPGRVGLHIAPRGDSHDMGDSNLLGAFTYVAQAAKARGLAFLCAREYVADGPHRA
jgi:2,4-dienoyl-CoA reductase-like NADH-dependent reductase (Old Yellow Enzyme family)